MRKREIMEYLSVLGIMLATLLVMGVMAGGAAWWVFNQAALTQETRGAPHYTVTVCSMNCDAGDQTP